MYQDGAVVSLLALDSQVRMGPLICVTEQVNTMCCRNEQTGIGIGAIGEWFYNDAMVTNLLDSGNNNLYRNRGDQQVILNLKDEMLVEGSYRCEVPDSQGFTVTASIVIVNSKLTAA